MIRKRTLVLNADFRPLSSISWKRAFTQVMVNREIPGEGLEVVEYYQDETVRSAGGKEFPIPAVVKTTKYIVRKKRKVPFSKRNVFIRDELTCQYCNGTFERKDLTIDHVVSRDEWRRKNCKGSPTNWTNIVTSCKSCNTRKGNKTLKECGLTLRNLPKEPNGEKHIPSVLPWGKLPAEWVPYLSVVYKNMPKLLKLIESGV